MTLADVGTAYARSIPADETPAYQQGTLAELGEQLDQVTFVVVDLETTGGSAADCAITEVGAVRVRGGEVLAEFQTLVDPGVGIPPFITVLTGITDVMVAAAPRIEAVLPAFLEFARGAVLVAHNAPFDLGFLKTACARTGRRWPAFRHVDTAVVARRALTREETRNCKLGTLAAYFDATTTPSHRALDDARATVEVLHGLIGRLSTLGVDSVEELTEFTHRVTAAQRSKRHLADAMPREPGVYIFRDRDGRPLYVGTSRNLRSRVRQYFGAGESRGRMRDMVALAERVDAIVCAHPLEAQVRELRLIAEHKPRFNRRSRFPERSLYLTLTAEPFPRLSIVRRPRSGDLPYLGPFPSRRCADAAAEAVGDVVALRRCSGRLSRRVPRAACALAEMGRCGAPCEDRESVTEYARHADAFRRAVDADPDAVALPALDRINDLGRTGRYADAAARRDQLIAFVRACVRVQRLRGLTDVAEIVAAHRRPDEGWDVTVIRRGRLVAAGAVDRGVPPWPCVAALRATAESFRSEPGPAPAASAEESECILRWLDLPETKVVRSDGAWVSPARGAGRWSAWLTELEGRARCGSRQ